MVGAMRLHLQAVVLPLGTGTNHQAHQASCLWCSVMSAALNPETHRLARGRGRDMAGAPPVSLVGLDVPSQQ